MKTKKYNVMLLLFASSYNTLYRKMYHYLCVSCIGNIYPHRRIVAGVFTTWLLSVTLL